jgi:hypothetical protein
MMMITDHYYYKFEQWKSRLYESTQAFFFLEKGTIINLLKKGAPSCPWVYMAGDVQAMKITGL